MLMILIGITLGLSLSLFILQYTWQRWTSRWCFIPGPRTVPWLGTAPFLEKEPNKHYNQLIDFFKQFDDFFILWFAFKPVVFCNRIEQVQQILSSQELTRKSTLYNLFEDWLCQGLLTSFGKKWRKRRRALTPSFHFAILNNFTQVFMDHAQTLVRKLDIIAKAGETIDFQKIASLTALNVICETAMGVRIEEQASASDYVDAVQTVCEEIGYRAKCPWLWTDTTYQITASYRRYKNGVKILHQFTSDVIKKNITDRKNNKVDFNNNVDENNNIDEENTTKKKKVFVDMLLDLYNEGKIDIQGVREEIDTFMSTGHDTVAAAFSWTVYCLGRHPEAQEKLHSIIDECAASNYKDIVDKIQQVKYLEYVIKESIRLHPVVPMFGRAVDKDITIGGVEIPAGTEIYIAPMALHRKSAYWSSPNEFKPERFGENEFLKRNPYIYLPFSAGPRNCIGQKFAMMELKVMLYHVCSKFRVESLQAESDLEIDVDIVRKASNGLMVRFQER